MILGRCDYFPNVLNLLIFIMETLCVSCETELLNVVLIKFMLQRVNNEKYNFLQSLNW
jgi:hypothetical protein